MRSNFELLSAHSNRIFDAILEIERKALWNHLEYRSIHEVYSILAHIEGTIHIIFGDIESCDGYDS